ncbi:hypothetical protein BD770DRAFT_430254 [Pilaira anomala]|nr:hypothetical protein BD770DRAFT_430254 [Pilaira anomala]
MLRLLCYLVSAISFVFPPASFLFEDFKVAHCNLVLKIDSVPAWVQEASSPEVCKAPSTIALFQKASSPDVCYKKEQPKALFVLKDPSKEIFVVNKPAFPVLPVCPVSAGTCKPILVMGLLLKEPVCRLPAFPFCPLPSPSLPPPTLKPGLIPTGEPFTLVVKGMLQNLLVVSKGLFWDRGHHRTYVILVLFLYLKFLRPRVRRRKTRCSCQVC